MADAPASTPPALTDAQLFAQKQRFWGSFTHLIMGGIVSIVILLVLMDYFLV